MSEMIAQARPMAMNPAARSNEESAGLKRRSVMLMIVLILLTAGLYYPFWFLRRRADLNRLDAPAKLSLGPLLVILGGTALNTFARLAASPASVEQTFGEGAATVVLLIQLSVALTMLWQCFRVKQILEDHLTGPDGDGSILKPQVHLSGPMTFFFGVLYLQHVINREIVGPARAA